MKWLRLTRDEWEVILLIALVVVAVFTEQWWLP
jgi:hypothetical protein